MIAKIKMDDKSLLTLRISWLKRFITQNNEKNVSLYLFMQGSKYTPNLKSSQKSVSVLTFKKVTITQGTNMFKKLMAWM